jgi:hypothetical protein
VATGNSAAGFGVVGHKRLEVAMAVLTSASEFKLGCERGWPRLTQRLFMTLVHSAAARGHTRDSLARHLGVPACSFEAWVKPSRGVMVNAAAFLALLMREDLAAEDVRAEVLRTLTAEAGVTVMPEVDADASPIVMQVCEIASALGQVADMTAAAGELDASEAREMRGAVAEVLRQAQELDGRLGEIEAGGAA